MPPHPSTHLPPDECPVCHGYLDAAGPITNAKVQPKPGDYSLCINCGALLRFDPGMRLQVVPDDDLLELPKGDVERLRRVQEMIQALHHGDAQ